MASFEKVKPTFFPYLGLAVGAPGERTLILGSTWNMEQEQRAENGWRHFANKKNPIHNAYLNLFKWK